jgi:hypothetical protein
VQSHSVASKADVDTIRLRKNNDSMIFPQLELLLAKPDSRQFPLKLCRKLLLVVDEYPREVEFFYL